MLTYRSVANSVDHRNWGGGGRRKRSYKESGFHPRELTIVTFGEQKTSNSLKCNKNKTDKLLKCQTLFFKYSCSVDKNFL